MTARAATPPGDETRTKAAWGAPLAQLDAAWTRVESLLCAVVLLSEIAALCVWIALNGLSTPSTGEMRAGILFRAIIGAIALGLASRAATRGMKSETREAIAVVAVLVGLGVAKLWAGLGVDYFSNLRNWLQDGSTLTLIGGLRGLGTRLTLWVALLGASLATASGKHINVDVVMRFLSPRARVPIAVASWLLAATVSLAAVWGFFDHIAIESFGAEKEATPAAKVAKVLDETSLNGFVLARQLELDARSVGHVLRGERYDAWMTGGEWNAWIDAGGWTRRWSADAVATLRVPVDATTRKAPLVIVPDGVNNRGLLGRDLDLIVPFGLLMIGLRFILRALLAIGGWVDVDPDAAHDDGRETHHGPPPLDGASIEGDAA